MSSSCPEFDRLLDSPSTFAARRLEEHIAHCPSCREQQAADDELRALFDGVSPPHLSPEFGSSLRRRLAAELPARTRRRCLVMRAYWLTVAAISVLLLVQFAGPQLRDSAAWRVGFLVLTTCLFLPTLLLGRPLGLGFFDLIARTVDPAHDERKALP